MSAQHILETLQQSIANDMLAVDRLIQTSLRSDVALVQNIAEYIIKSGGKRLRPVVTVLSAAACGYQGTHHYHLATIVEFIHTATLLHDDVVDESTQRRGRDTANEIFGNAASILVGDFLYSRAFQLMVSIGSLRIMEILADTTNIIAEGEVLQLLNCHNADLLEADYLHVIRYKTAKLFEAAGQLGAVIADANTETETALASYGRHLGTAFQLLDDVLDYSGSAEEIGKNLGDDLAEGKPTLPLIRVLQTGTPEQIKVVRQAIEQGGLEHFDLVLNAVHATDALAYTRLAAQHESKLAQAAIQHLPASPHREHLMGLAILASNRTF